MSNNIGDNIPPQPTLNSTVDECIPSQDWLSNFFEQEEQEQEHHHHHHLDDSTPQSKKPRL